MPEFPRHDSNRALTTDQPRAFRDDADIRTDAADRNKIAANAIDTVTDTTVKWNAAVEKIQADTASYNMKMGLLDIGEEAVNDNDITAEPKYQKKVEDLRKSVTKGMSQSLANRIAADLDYTAKVGSIGIQQNFRKKTILHGQAVKMGDLTLLANKQVPGGIEAIKATVADAVKSGYWDEVEGLRMETKYTKDFKQNSFISDMNENPAETEQKLLKNDYQFDIVELENAGKIYEQQLKVIRDQTEKLLMQKKLDGTLQEDEIRQLVKIKKLDPTAAIAMIKDLNTVVAPKVDANTKAYEFNKLVAMREALHDKESAWLGLGNADFDQRTKYRAAVYDAHRKGYITTEEMDKNFISPEISEKFKRDPDFNNAIKEINALSDHYQSREEQEIARAGMTKSITEKVMNGMKPQDALQAASAEQIAHDYPGVNPKDLLATAYQRKLKVWQVYKLLPASQKGK